MSKFKSHNTETFREIPPNKTFFVRANIKQSDIFRELLPTNATHIFQRVSHYTFSESYFKRILNIFSEFRSNNINIYRVTAKHYCKIILSYKFYKKNLTFSEVLPNTNTFSTEDIPDNTFFSLRCGLILNLYWLD